MATYSEEVSYLKSISPESLPNNTAEAGLTAEQIKEKFYAPLNYLHSLLEDVRTAYASADSSLQSSINSLQTEITSLQTTINNLEISVTDLNNFESLLTGLQTQITTNAGDITTIKSSIAGLTTSISTLRSDIINGVVTAYSAVRDGNGRIIANYYASASALANVQSLFNYIVDGTTTVGKAAADRDGNIFDTTYVKKSDVVDGLTSTSTDAPLSANQGKVLKDALDALSNYIYSGAANTSIDRLTEVFEFLTGHDDDETLDGILAEKMSYTDLVTDYTSNLSAKPVAASVAYALKALIDLKVNTSDVIYEPQLTFTTVSIEEE